VANSGHAGPAPTTLGATIRAASTTAGPAHDGKPPPRCIDGSGRRIGPDFPHPQAGPWGASTRAPKSTMNGSDDGSPARAPLLWMYLREQGGADPDGHAAGRG